MEGNSFIEVDHSRKFKESRFVGGDIFLSRKIKDENRMVAVLSDGLGSGIKASVLSTLTATMALNYASNNFDLYKTARVIMKTLPVCSERKISYSTFTIIDIDKNGNTNIAEYGNPAFILLRNGKIHEIPGDKVSFSHDNIKNDNLYFYKFRVQMGDSIIVFSDGVTQAGTGTPSYPLGWGDKPVGEFVTHIVESNKGISARELSRKIVNKACSIDNYRAGDDITCGIINIRKPRKLLVMTGPPINRDRDKEMAAILDSFKGKKIICGGTTTNIISRELKRDVTVNLKDFNPNIPATSSMEGTDLITEGSLTMGEVVKILENDINPETLSTSGATKMIQLLLDSDIIHFVVGTKINDAHQAPNVPVELEIRRNIIKKIVDLLEEKHLKETSLQFI